MKKYDREDGKLKLKWVTPHACAKSMPGAGEGSEDGKKGDSDGKQPASSSAGGWGFFSWFFFL